MAAAIPAVVGVGAQLLGSRSARKESQRAQAAQTAQQQQAIEAQQEALAQSQELRQPFTEFGAGFLPQLGQAIGEPRPTQEQQFVDLTQNPLFQAARGVGERDIVGRLANRGLLGSGTESQALSENLLLSAAPILQRQQALQEAQRQQDIQNLFRAAGIGQASAVGQAADITGAGARIGGLQTGLGDIARQGITERANIRSATTEGLVSALPGIISGVGGFFGRTPPPTPFGGIQNPNQFGGIA